MIIRPGDPDFWNPEAFLPMLKVRSKTEGMIPFRLWSHQRILAASVRRAVAERKWLVHIKSRQTGSSTFFAGIVYQHAAFRKGCWAAILAHKKPTARNLAEMCNRYWRSTPKSIRPERHGRVKRTLEFPRLDSRIDVASVRDSEPLRGDTVQILLATELSSWLDSAGEDAWISARNAVPDVGGFILAESTPRHLDDQLHQVVKEAEMPNSKWHKIFIPWTMIDEYRTEPPPGWKPNAMVQGYWDRHPQMQVSHAVWMQQVGLAKCAYKLNRFRAEFPIDETDCWLSPGESIYDRSALRKMIYSIDGSTNISESNDEYQEYQAPVEGHKYVIFVDPAASWSKRDYFAVVVLDCTDCSQAAELLGHKNAWEMAQFLAKTGRRYNEAMLYVEANGVGEGILSNLIDNPKLKYRRVFHRTSRQVGGGVATIPGWWSSEKTKRAAEGALQDLLIDGSLTIHSVRSVKQLMNYRGTWGKRRDSYGGHYDLANAWAGAAWAYMKTPIHGRWGKGKVSAKEEAQIAWEKFMERIEPQKDSDSPWGDHL